jgi:predicted double-glycine peptidase
LIHIVLAVISSMEKGPPMQRFRLLKQTRQSTEYSCGASALQAVMSYWGKDVDEAELMRLLGTTPEEGTWPEDLVRVAREQGLEAELKSDLTLEDVERATAQGHPVIVLGQVWRSSSSDAASVAEEWDCGHWFIVLDIDQDHVYFEDPYVRMGKGFVPRATFEDAWHNVMGGDRSKPVQSRVGIFIRGDKPAALQRLVGDFSGLATGAFGSLNLLVTEFRGVVLPFDFVTELQDVLSSSMVRPDAFIFLRLDQQGGLTAVQGGRVEHEDEVMEITAVLGVLAGLAEGKDVTRESAQAARQAAAEGDFGLSVAELKRIAEKLQPGDSAIIALFENLWERKFREIAAKHNGTVINQRLISSDMLVRLGQELRKCAETDR